MHKNPNSLAIQRGIRSVWQHHRNSSYCLFGSKKHLMSELFYSRNMPFYQFGDMFFLKKIPTEKWTPFIVERFAKNGKQISEQLAEKIALTVDNYSAYVQQLAWNVFTLTDKVADEETLQNGLEATLAQASPLFVEMTANLSSFQLNFIRAICHGFHTDFSKKEVTSRFPLGTRSNLPRLKASLTDREIIETDERGIVLADPLFELWFKREMM